MQVAQQVKQAAMVVTITRADGRVEELGVVGYYHRSPLRRLRYAILKRLGRVVAEHRVFG